MIYHTHMKVIQVYLPTNKSRINESGQFILLSANLLINEKANDCLVSVALPQLSSNHCL